MKRPQAPYLLYGKPYLPRKPEAKIPEFIPIKDFAYDDQGYYSIVLPKNVKPTDIIYNRMWNGYDSIFEHYVPGYIVNNSNPNYTSDMCAYGIAMHNYRLLNDKYKKEMLSFPKRKAAYDKKMLAYKKWEEKENIIKLEKRLEKFKAKHITAKTS